MSKPEDKCVVPAKGPISTAAAQETVPIISDDKEASDMAPLVGREAPDFEASAYYAGGFQNVRLSDYRGQWVAVCFYPGDFTFV